jgi:hypothetical protein
MEVIVKQIDIPRTRASWPDTLFTPAYVASREQGDRSNWVVADSPVPDDAAVGISWAYADSDEYVRIPLFEYTIKPHGNLALTFAFKLGVIAANALQAPIKKLYLVTGTPVELIQDSNKKVIAMSYWFGFAFSTED